MLQFYNPYNGKVSFELDDHLSITRDGKLEGEGM